MGWNVGLGMKSESAIVSVKVEERGIASMSKLEYFQNMHTILLMELEDLQLAIKAKDSINWKNFKF